MKDMKTKSLYLLILLICSFIAEGQVLRPFTSRYYNSSVRGNIVYVSNNIITSAGAGTSDAPPTGSETNNSYPGQYIDIDNVRNVFFPYSTTWKYLANNTRPANWQTVAYNDAAWPTGTAKFGYGDGDEVTCVPSGGGGTLCNPTGNKYISTYFRKVVNIPNPSAFTAIRMNVIMDDGIVVYVNGVERGAYNMPAGRTHATLASAAYSPEGVPVVFNLNPAFFNAGNNTIAVEIHQNSATSTDLAFSMELEGITDVTFFPHNTTWKYLANNTRPANWSNVGYNDGAWPTGTAQFGYGDGDETTCVPSGGGGTTCTPTGNKYITTYFRKIVNIPNPNLFSYFRMNVIRDDGIVIYVNGLEVASNNMPAGRTHTTLALGAIGNAGETTPISFSIPPSAFVAGNNTIAVEIHQNDQTSTDLSFSMELVGMTDSSGTFSSSSSDLSLPTCSNVLFAGLYWGADQGSSGTDSSWILNGFNTVKIKIPGSSTYQTVTASQADRHSEAYSPGLPHTGYLCFADITSLINASNPNGTYTIADVIGPEGYENSCGGWTIVIAYANPTLQPRNLSVFDGSVIINQGDPPVDVPITGFLTPPGGPVSCELGAVVFDGDRGAVDSFSFRQFGAPAFYNMATTTVPLNGAADAWNSKISYKGSVVTTRSPAHANTLGYDASIHDLPNAGNAQLGNSRTSATVRFSSSGENYFVQVLSTSISQYNPTFAFSKAATDINGGSTFPGDSLQYQLNYSNVGNDASTNTTIIDNIPAGTSYLPNSLSINGVAKTDAAGDDEAEFDLVNNRVIFRVGTGANGVNGGTINTSGSGNVRFSVVIASSCRVLTCLPSIRNTARINYTGLTSGLSLYDSSGVNVAGCITPGPSSVTPVSSCYTPADTLIVNQCPVTSLLIPWRRYAGYTIYSAQPFIPANIYNANLPVTASNVFYAYYTNGAGCSDTVRINMIVTACPDIDDDDDGIPDYVEFNNALALQDHNSNGVPNWNDAAYPGYVNNNSDNVNDNFDWGADSDNDGIPNFADTNFWIAFVDTNGDGVNDNSDKDLDGVPNQFDRDSDNDGIPDVVESGGVDANGDGRIDNFTDTDNDGLSQNVDANNTGVNGSGLGLTAVNLDNDAIPNYLDLDSDNDGIPDIIEALGTDANNNGMVDVTTDTDGDGLVNALDGDADNNGIAENSANALLRSGPDANNNGRADSWPYKNFDNDARPNPYDVDSDMDGIVDVLEAGFADADFNGFIDGAIGNHGWNNAVDALGTLNLTNTDSRGNPDYLDIDSDDDGIPDNVEGMTTLGYVLPTYLDNDGDGLDNAYDNVPAAFGGRGVFLSDRDMDGIPDYRDLDTDSDGMPDIFEGNDFNFNGDPDDDVALTFLDTDGDGLDNKFDSLNSVTNVKGTSYRMGTGGSFSGDPAPGSRTVVQRSNPLDSDRDWRSVTYVLFVNRFELMPAVNDQFRVQLSWILQSPFAVSGFEIERSSDNIHFNKVGDLVESIAANIQQQVHFTDLVNENGSRFYYRVKALGTNGLSRWSNVVAVTIKNNTISTVYPNPASHEIKVAISSEEQGKVIMQCFDEIGRNMFTSHADVQKGINNISLNTTALPEGVYILKLSGVCEHVHKFIIKR